MAENAVVRARIDEKTKRKATRVLKSIGMTPSGAFRLMMRRIAKDKAMPFELLVPNAATVEALEKARRGGSKTFATVAELIADLNADE